MRTTSEIITGILLSFISLSAVEPFDYHSIRREGKVTSDGIIEGESQLRRQGKARPQDMRGFGPHWRGNAHLLWNGVVGDTNLVEFNVPKAGKYALSVQWTLAPAYGIFEVRLNDKVLAAALDL